MDPNNPKDLTDNSKNTNNTSNINLLVDTGYTLEQNIKNRPDYMEDMCNIDLSFMGDKNKALLMLYDGHSGIEVAKESIDKFPEIFKASLFNKNEDTEEQNTVEEAFKEAFDKLDSEFIKYEDVGSTAIIAYVCIENGKKVIYTANAGDSRAILFKKDKCIRLSFDHKAIDKTEIARAKKAGGMFFRGRLGGSLAITRSLGDYVFKKDGGFGLISEPYVNRTLVEEGDMYIILASDGVWDVINEEQCYKLVNDNLKLSAGKMSELIVKTSMDLGSKDNISCIVARLN